RRAEHLARALGGAGEHRFAQSGEAQQERVAVAVAPRAEVPLEVQARRGGMHQRRTWPAQRYRPGAGARVHAPGYGGRAGAVQCSGTVPRSWTGRPVRTVLRAGAANRASRASPSAVTALPSRLVTNATDIPSSGSA